MTGLISLAVSVMASAIIIRDDVPDSAYRAHAKRPEFGAATRILVDSSGSASGVLVAPQWVITAAHVVSKLNASQVRVLVGGTIVRVERVVVHPDYAKHTGLERSGFDQALLKLEHPANVAPAQIDTRLPDIGALVTMVGYGVGGVGARDTAGTLRAATNRIDQIGGKMRSFPLAANLLVMDFDMPNQEAANAMGSAIPEPLEGLASGGDSGGGLFVQRDGKWLLTGTFSVSSVSIGAVAARNFSGSLNIFVGIAANREWIESIMH